MRREMSSLSVSESSSLSQHPASCHPNYTGLYQTYLPKRATVDILEFDTTDETIQYHSDTYIQRLVAVETALEEATK